jgi:transcriptional regulator with XRE-family HTH domain
LIAVDGSKRKRLEAAGWKVGDVADFLGLTREEAELIEVKLALGDYMRQLRRGRGLTQAQVAELIGSSQSRVAKMEAADASVSIDLVTRALFTLGASIEDAGRVLTRTLGPANALPTEGLMGAEALAEYIRTPAAERFPGDLDRRAFMRLPLEERRAAIRAQAKSVAAQYNADLDAEWLDAALGEGGAGDE